MVGDVIHRRLGQFAGRARDILADGAGDAVADVVNLADVLVDGAGFLGFLAREEDVVPAAVGHRDGFHVEAEWGYRLGWGLRGLFVAVLV